MAIFLNSFHHLFQTADRRSNNLVIIAVFEHSTEIVFVPSVEKRMGTTLQDSSPSPFTFRTMRIFNVLIDCKVKGIYFITQSASWDCLARQSISIDVLYKREFKSDDEVNISAEDKDVDVTIANDDHN